jgi:predicted DNA-binding ribbon-helix-helix protein
MPVVFSSGLRLLENIDAEQVRLEKRDVREIGARTSFRFRVLGR